VKFYVGQLLAHIRALLSCSDVIFDVHNMLMCIIGANKMMTMMMIMMTMIVYVNLEGQGYW